MKKIRVISLLLAAAIAAASLSGCTPVSYTHLDVYKRQAYNNIRLDSHTLQLFDRSLGWFGLHFTGCFQVRNQCDMDQDCIFMTDFMLELTDRLKERLTFNITDCTAGLYDLSLIHI